MYTSRTPATSDHMPGPKCGTSKGGLVRALNHHRTFSMSICQFGHPQHKIFHQSIRRVRRDEVLAISKFLWNSRKHQMTLSYLSSTHERCIMGQKKDLSCLVVAQISIFLLLKCEWLYTLHFGILILGIGMRGSSTSISRIYNMRC